MGSFEPFEDASDNRLQTLALSSLFATYFLGLLLQLKATSEQNHAFAGLLIVVTSAVITWAVASHMCPILCKHVAPVFQKHVVPVFEKACGDKLWSCCRKPSVSKELRNTEMTAIAIGTGTNPGVDMEDGNGGARAEVEELRAEVARLKQKQGEYVRQRVASEVRDLRAQF